MSRDTTPFEVLIDERVEKDLEKVPKYIVRKFIKLLDEFEIIGFFMLSILRLRKSE